MCLASGSSFAKLQRILAGFFWAAAFQGLSAERQDGPVYRYGLGCTAS